MNQVTVPEDQDWIENIGRRANEELQKQLQKFFQIAKKRGTDFVAAI